MKKILLLLVSCFFVFSSLSFASSKYEKISDEELKTIKFLNDSELKELFSNGNLKGYSYKREKNFEYKFNPDGTVTGKNAKGKKIAWKWHIKDGMKCMTKSNGKSFCRKHYFDGEKYYNVDSKNRRTAEFTFSK